ncbi:MAG: hypothetical protein JF616_18175 [Fibrobacteres bacterium]|nr:hypothetical protein [Fibrobacterota bacterium]
MRTALLRYCLPVTLVFPALSLASLGYALKHDADLYRTETLEPPPLASLEAGQSVRMLHPGAAQSLVETVGGLKGWVRNGDLLALAPAGAQKHELPNQKVTGAGDVNVSPWVNNGAVDADMAVAPDRAFAAEIIETLDKEQVEMRHDEN